MAVRMSRNYVRPPRGGEHSPILVAQLDYSAVPLDVRTNISGTPRPAACFETPGFTSLSALASYTSSLLRSCGITTWSTVSGLLNTCPMCDWNGVTIVYG